MLITLVTHAGIPDGVEDDHRLAAALVAAGADTRLAAWNDRAVDWSAGSVTVIRSTWDYHLDPKAWFAWLVEASACTRLVNPVELVRWNSEKTYLLDLAMCGVPVIPTVLLKGTADIAAICAERGWDDVVVKPTIGASAHGTRRFEGNRIYREGTAMSHLFWRAAKRSCSLIKRRWRLPASARSSMSRAYSAMRSASPPSMRASETRRCRATNRRKRIEVGRSGASCVARPPDLRTHRLTAVHGWAIIDGG